MSGGGRPPFHSRGPLSSRVGRGGGTTQGARWQPPLSPEQVAVAVSAADSDDAAAAVAESVHFVWARAQVF